MSTWTNQKVLVTGGASFIGSQLVDQLIARGACVRVVDDLTSGRLENIAGHLGNGHLEFRQADLREPGVARAAVEGVDTVFHLAADHGGRGYVEWHQAGTASNFLLDGLVFAEALKAKVKKVSLPLPAASIPISCSRIPMKKEPRVPFCEGVRRTADWYYKSKDRTQVKAMLNRMLTER